jgi:hypothetical protein
LSENNTNLPNDLNNNQSLLGTSEKKINTFETLERLSSQNPNSQKENKDSEIYNVKSYLKKYENKSLKVKDRNCDFKKKLLIKDSLNSINLSDNKNKNYYRSSQQMNPRYSNEKSIVLLNLIIFRFRKLF